MATALHMTQDLRLELLKNKHADLSDRVKKAQRSLGMPDDAIQAMKKQKLMLKEQIEEIRATGN